MHKEPIWLVTQTGCLPRTLDVKIFDVGSLTQNTNVGHSAILVLLSRQQLLSLASVFGGGDPTSKFFKVQGAEHCCWRVITSIPMATAGNYFVAQVTAELVLCALQNLIKCTVRLYGEVMMFGLAGIQANLVWNCFSFQCTCPERALTSAFITCIKLVTFYFCIWHFLQVCM